MGRRIVLAGIAAGAVVLTAGCAAGQIAQTAEEQPAVPGAQASVGPIQLHNITVAYPSGGVYDAGSTARLNFVITNTGLKADHLVSVSSGSARTVQIVPKKSGTVAPQGGTAAATLKIGPQANLRVFGPGPKVLMVGLVRPLRSSQQTTVTFRFAKAGQVRVGVPVAPSAKTLPKTAITSAD